MKSAQISKYIYSTKPIGKGAFSKVYKGFDTDNDHIIAIKVIEKINIKQELVVRLRDEITLISQLQHPHIANFVEFLQDDDCYYLIMEYCAGGDLAHRIKMGKIPELLANLYMHQLADALAYLKAKNIIHRDLKPQNILLTLDQKNIKVTDFNFARELYDNDLAQTMCGSPLYMAPEIIANNSYSVKSDLWSTGIILYEMVYGKSPYHDSRTIIELAYLIKTRPIKYNNTVSADCNDLINGLLQTQPSRRLDWDTFFNHHWLSIDLASSTEYKTESGQAISAPISISNFKLEYVDNYIPLGITPPTNTRSEPVNIFHITPPNSYYRSFNPGSAPEPRSVTDNIWSYMTSSAAIVKGAVDYISHSTPKK